MRFATLRYYLYLCRVAVLLIWNVFAKIIISNDLSAKSATFFILY
jgi:hypothetical protein